MRRLLLDFLFPKYCIQCKKFGDLLCANCFALISYTVSTVCPLCNKPSITGRTHNQCYKTYSIDGLIPCVAYSGVVKKLTYQFKYEPYLSSLQEIIGPLMEEYLEQHEIFQNILQSDPLVIPIPLHSSKMKKRGYNHAALLGYHVAQYFDLEFNADVLIRSRNTKPQYGLSKPQRFTNISGAFSVNKKYADKFKNRNIIIIDDIATTCSTLRESASVLKRKGATSVWGIVFAKEG